MVFSISYATKEQDPRLHGDETYHRLQKMCVSTVPLRKALRTMTLYMHLIHLLQTNESDDVRDRRKEKKANESCG